MKNKTGRITHHSEILQGETKLSVLRIVIKHQSRKNVNTVIKNESL